MPDRGEPRLPVLWWGDTKEVLSSFPTKVKENLGYGLHLVQVGERPLDSKALPGVGPSVFELRDQDARGWYRVVYWTRSRSAIHVLHCFEKQTNRIEKRDLRTIQERRAQAAEYEARQERSRGEKDER
jgi:phage-related protein